MTPADIAGWHAHLDAFPPDVVMDYVALTAQVSDDDGREALKKMFPGPARWMGT